MDAEAALEALTEETLSEIAYLAANPDVRDAGMSARDHYLLHGRAEGRGQLAGAARARAEKYERFRGVLAAPLDTHPGRTFPIRCGRRHFDLADYASESANPSFAPFDAQIAGDPDGLYLDLGCGYRETTFPNCLYLEVYPSRSADLVVEPDCRYPIRSNSLDGIGCFAVLEHTRQPWLVVSEMKRMLKPGGRVFIDWPFLQPVHGYPSHFFNATREGLASLFEDNGFSIEHCATEANQTPAYTMRWVLGAMAHNLPEGEMRSLFAGTTVGELVALDVQGETWRRWLGALPAAAVSELACGNTLIATKGGAAGPARRPPAPPAGQPMPPVELRERVSGTRDPEAFDLSGRRTVDEWRRALASAGRDIGSFPRVVDFGCGCGRATRFLHEQLGPDQRLVGLDTDADAVRWLGEALPDAAFHAIAPLPRTPLADGDADLVLSHSVFTHLPEDIQFLWLEELRRVLAPGGLLVASFHGAKALGEFTGALTGTPREGELEAIGRGLDGTGFHHLAGRTDAERSYPLYYGAAFHTLPYVARTWLRWFDLVAWHPAFALDLQDVAVLRAKPAA